MVNILTGLGENVGAALVAHPGVDKIAFTGSTEVGKIINKAASDTVKRVSLELGGKSPVIVLPDAPLDAVIGGAANAIFFNSGQVCCAGSRLYAHRKVFDQVLEGVSGAAERHQARPGPRPDDRDGAARVEGAAGPRARSTSSPVASRAHPSPRAVRRRRTPATS